MLNEQINLLHSKLDYKKIVEDIRKDYNLIKLKGITFHHEKSINGPITISFYAINIDGLNIEYHRDYIFR